MNETPSSPPPVDGPRQRGADGAVAWARRELSTDGARRALDRLAGLLKTVRLAALPVLAVGVVGVLLAVLAFRDHPAILAIMVVLCLPAILASLFAFRGITRVHRAVAHPDQVVTQARSLAGNLTDSRELRELASLVTRRRTSSGPVEQARPGRIRRTLKAAKLGSSVLGQVQPNKDDHPLLVPFVPERIGRLWFSISWTFMGLVIALAVCAISVIGIIINVL